ncbi:MAG: hypothetical protein AAB628_01485 [Patescibacteria group bacterium]
MKRETSNHISKPSAHPQFAIGMLDLSQTKDARKWLTLPVSSHANGAEVTKDMLIAEVGALNQNTGLHGRTVRPIKRVLAFRLQQRL